MSPRDLSVHTVAARLTLMRELLDDLDALGRLSREELTRDRILRRAVERILTQLVDLAVDINQHIASTTAGRIVSEYRESFDAAAEIGAISTDLAGSLKPSVGLRNVLTHEYVNTDLTLIAAAIPQAVSGYAEYVRQVATWLSAPRRA